jgi:hypothetical protein
MWGTTAKLGLIAILTFWFAMGISVGVMSTIDDGSDGPGQPPDGPSAENGSDTTYGGGSGDDSSDGAANGSDERSSDDTDQGDGEDGSSEDEADSSDRTDPEPELQFDITALEVCGLTCREATATLANTGGDDATNVTAEVTVLSGGEKLLTTTRAVGTFEADERQTRSVPVDGGTADGYVIQDNDGRITIETTLVHDDGQDRFVEQRNVFVADSEGDTVDGDFELVVENLTECSVTCREITTTMQNNGQDAATIDRVDMTVLAGDTELFQRSFDGDVLGPDDSRTRTRQFEIDLFGSTAIARNGGFVTVEFDVHHDDGTAEFRTKRNRLR